MFLPCCTERIITTSPLRKKDPRCLPGFGSRGAESQPLGARSGRYADGCMDGADVRGGGRAGVRRQLAIEPAPRSRRAGPPSALLLPLKARSLDPSTPPRDICRSSGPIVVAPVLIEPACVDRAVGAASPPRRQRYGHARRAPGGGFIRRGAPGSGFEAASAPFPALRKQTRSRTR